MATNAGSLATKAAVAAAVAGGGVLLTSGAAGAAEPPPPAPPTPLEEWGQQLLVEYGPQLLELQQQLDQFVEGLKPADDPNVAEVEVTPEHASGTAWQDDQPDNFVFGRSEATPTTARVTILRAFGQDLLTKEGDADGGHYGGAMSGLGDVIDWVNEQTCPSGVHGGAEACLTFLDSSATTREITDDQEFTQDVPLGPVIGGLVPESFIDGLPLSSSRKAALKTARTNYLGTLGTVEATGTSEGTATDNDATFHAIKYSKGGDSIALLPTSASSGSFALAPGTLQTAPFTIGHPLRALLPAIIGQQLTNLIPTSVIPTNLTVPAQSIEIPGTDRVCTSSASADTVAGTGVFADLAAFFGSPKQDLEADGCELPEVTEVQAAA